jgi:hypothetical protein
VWVWCLQRDIQTQQNNRKDRSSYFCFQILCFYTMTGHIVLLFGSLSDSGGIQISKVSSLTLTPDNFENLRCDTKSLLQKIFLWVQRSHCVAGQIITVYFSRLKIQQFFFLFFFFFFFLFFFFFFFCIYNVRNIYICQCCLTMK